MKYAENHLKIKLEVIFFIKNLHTKMFSSAWKILLDTHIDTFPVPVKRVATHLGIPVLRYSRGEDTLKELGVYDAAMSSDGITLPLADKHVIMYDDNIRTPRARVAIGHELGHIMMGHTQPGTVMHDNHPPRPWDSPREFEANLWCEQLIAPTGVLLAANLTTRESIERVCQVNRRASDFILARLAERSGYIPSDPSEIEVVRRFMRSL